MDNILRRERRQGGRWGSGFEPGTLWQDSTCLGDSEPPSRPSAEEQSTRISAKQTQNSDWGRGGTDVASLTLIFVDNGYKKCGRVSRLSLFYSRPVCGSTIFTRSVLLSFFSRTEIWKTDAVPHFQHSRSQNPILITHKCTKSTSQRQFHSIQIFPLSRTDIHLISRP